MQLAHKDDAGVAATLETLSKPDAPEREIVAAAAALNSAWDKDHKNEKLATQSQTLLQNYLKAARSRSLSAEIEARYRLGWLLLEQKQPDKAKAALDLSALHFDEKFWIPKANSFSRRSARCKLKSPLPE